MRGNEYLTFIKSSGRFPCLFCPTNQDDMDANLTNRTAGMAGLFYFLHIGLSAFGLGYVNPKFTTGNAPGIQMQTLLQHEALFRAGIFTRLASAVPWLLLAFALYRLLKSIHEGRAKTMLVLMILSMPIGFIAESANLTALLAAKGELWCGFETAQRQDWVSLLLGFANTTIPVSEILWGAWLIPFGLLACRSRFLPRALGIMLIVAGCGYLIEWTSFLLHPAVRDIVSPVTLGVGGLVEIITMAWLLLKGVRLGEPHA